MGRRCVVLDCGGGDDESSVARAREWRTADGGPLPGKMQARIWKARAGIIGGGARPAAALPLAGKRARIAEYAGARGDPGGWVEHSGRGPAVTCLEAGCRTSASGHACGEF